MNTDRPLTEEELDARLAALSDEDRRQVETGRRIQLAWDRVRMTEEVLRLRAAIRQHRDERGDDRCHADDGRLYAVLPEGDTRPARETLVTIENCQRYIECRQTGREYVSPQRRIAELEAIVTDLRATLRRIQGACGIPDAHEACRAVLKLAAEALADARGQS